MSNMAKNRFYWMGDMLTKIGCGVCGGYIVAFSIGKIEKSQYYLGVIVPMCLILIGYYLISKNEE